MTSDMGHNWKWVGQGERFAFGDPDKPYAVDYWVCVKCGKETSSRSTQSPALGKCKGRKAR